MNKMSKKIAITSAIAAGLALAGTASADGHGHDSGAKKVPTMEKCYGIVKAGKNDCGIKSQGTHCAGAAKSDGIADAWIYVPRGTCDKIVGGSTEAPKS